MNHACMQGFYLLGCTPDEPPPVGIMPHLLGMAGTSEQAADVGSTANNNSTIGGDDEGDKSDEVIHVPPVIVTPVTSVENDQEETFVLESRHGSVYVMYDVDEGHGAPLEGTTVSNSRDVDEEGGLLPAPSMVRGVRLAENRSLDIMVESLGLQNVGEDSLSHTDMAVAQEYKEYLKYLHAVATAALRLGNVVPGQLNASERLPSVTARLVIPQPSSSHPYGNMVMSTMSTNACYPDADDDQHCQQQKVPTSIGGDIRGGGSGAGHSDGLGPTSIGGDIRGGGSGAGHSDGLGPTSIGGDIRGGGLSDAAGHSDGLGVGSHKLLIEEDAISTSSRLEHVDPAAAAAFEQQERRIRLHSNGGMNSNNCALLNRDVRASPKAKGAAYTGSRSSPMGDNRSIRSPAPGDSAAAAATTHQNVVKASPMHSARASPIHSPRSSPMQAGYHAVVSQSRWGGIPLYQFAASSSLLGSTTNNNAAMIRPAAAAASVSSAPAAMIRPAAAAASVSPAPAALIRPAAAAASVSPAPAALKPLQINTLQLELNGSYSSEGHPPIVVIANASSHLRLLEPPVSASLHSALRLSARRPQPQRAKSFIGHYDSRRYGSRLAPHFSPHTYHSTVSSVWKYGENLAPYQQQLLYRKSMPGFLEEGPRFHSSNNSAASLSQAATEGAPAADRDQQQQHPSDRDQQQQQQHSSDRAGASPAQSWLSRSYDHHPLHQALFRSISPTPSLISGDGAEAASKVHCMVSRHATSGASSSKLAWEESANYLSSPPPPPVLTETNKAVVPTPSHLQSLIIAGGNTAGQQAASVISAPASRDTSRPGSAAGRSGIVAKSKRSVAWAADIIKGEPGGTRAAVQRRSSDSGTLFQVAGSGPRYNLGGSSSGMKQAVATAALSRLVRTSPDLDLEHGSQDDLDGSCSSAAFMTSSSPEDLMLALPPSLPSPQPASVSADDGPDFARMCPDFARMATALNVNIVEDSSSNTAAGGVAAVAAGASAVEDLNYGSSEEGALIIPPEELPAGTPAGLPDGSDFSLDEGSSTDSKQQGFWRRSLFVGRLPSTSARRVVPQQ
ncbi:hypothetical protein CEUSTIGMA_g8652.t1 [Chlamydomonas eustigma]|uniref:Uncharacterized protein n=1 Tax=Chlamydomonas eustigma TaxID=1157962 RepID=A0A250XEL6_9CHLO|nr:hypothetical protein CEUSTIGMA_g8652.t1 [Chlamydomonas eustigma]|eukprot:GAX81220.1 hypothetical protein CEUSTIGMA_g8652.t1 [Chlamydomonas eustigma]